MKWLMCIFFLIKQIILFSQDNIGIEYGLGNSNIINHTTYNDRYKKSTFISLGLYSRVNIKKNVYLKYGLNIENREFIVNGLYHEILGDYPNYFLGSDTVSRNRFNNIGYLSLPIVFQSDLRISKFLSLQIAVGGYYSYLLKQIWSYKYDGGRYQYDNYGPLSPIDSPFEDKYKKSDIGFIFNLGISYKINRNLNVSFSGMWQRGIINIIDTKEVIAFSEVTNLSIGLGYLFK